MGLRLTAIGLAFALFRSTCARFSVFAFLKPIAEGNYKKISQKDRFRCHKADGPLKNLSVLHVKTFSTQ